MEQPAAATGSHETHGSLVLGLYISGDLIVQMSTATTRQLRSGSTRNPWEVGWVLWNYGDNTRFWYFDEVSIATPDKPRGKKKPR